MSRRWSNNSFSFKEEEEAAAVVVVAEEEEEEEEKDLSRQVDQARGG
jgi:hypothetical protein